MIYVIQDEQKAYAGLFSLRDKESGLLLHGGGVIAPRPRLYQTHRDALQAQRDVQEDCDIVFLDV